MDFKVFTYKTQIKEYHLDTFGHVNNAVYLNLYEEARWDFITGENYGLDFVLKEKIGPVILEVNVKYKKELKNREWITIESQSEWVRGKLMSLKQIIKKEDGSIASDASFLVGLMDMKERKMINPTDNWLKAIGAKV